MAPAASTSPLSPGGLAAPHGIPGHLVDFVEALRRRGIMVGPSETVDAGQVMSVLDLLDREALREGLACSLLRRPTHRATFDAVFDLWFPKRSVTVRSATSTSHCRASQTARSTCRHCVS